MKDDVQLIKNLFGKKKSTPAARLSEPAQPAKPALTPQAWLLELFKRHGLASTVHNDWVLPGGELPAVRGTPSTHFTCCRPRSGIAMIPSRS